MAEVYWRNDDGEMEPIGSPAWLALPKIGEKPPWWRRLLALFVSPTPAPSGAALRRRRIFRLAQKAGSSPT